MASNSAAMVPRWLKDRFAEVRGHLSAKPDWLKAWTIHIIIELLEDEHFNPNHLKISLERIEGIFRETERTIGSEGLFECIFDEKTMEEFLQDEIVFVMIQNDVLCVPLVWHESEEEFNRNVEMGLGLDLDFTDIGPDTLDDDPLLPVPCTQPQEDEVQSQLKENEVQAWDKTFYSKGVVILTCTYPATAGCHSASAPPPFEALATVAASAPAVPWTPLETGPEVYILDEKMEMTFNTEHYENDPSDARRLHSLCSGIKMTDPFLAHARVLTECRRIDKVAFAPHMENSWYVIPGMFQEKNSLSSCLQFF